MLIYNLIEDSNAYSKRSGSFRQYCKDEPTIPNNGDIIDFSANNNDSALLKLKQQITEKETGNSGTKNVEIIVPLKYLSSFWRNAFN